MEGTFVALDLETTGPDPLKDKIIEVGMVKIVDGKETETYHSMINPGVRLPLKIKRLTGISEEMLVEKPGIEDVIHEISSFIDNYPIIGHNVEFDKNFISTAMGRSLNPIPNTAFDTVELARIIMPDAPNHRLATLCSLLNIEIPVQHRALEDARAAANLAVELVDRLYDLELPVFMDLVNMLEKANSHWYPLVQQIAHKRSREFSTRKITSFSGLKPPPQQFYELLLHDEKNNKSPEPIKEDEINQYLGSDGLLGKVIPDFEHRPQQLAMARAVASAMNEGVYLLAEAGTGTGKSMAYLLPAVLWAKKNNQKIVISTHTINLQEQLLNKDVPLLQSLPGMDFRVCLVKGRSNYLCLRRWYSILKTKDCTPGEAVFYSQILVWLTKTYTGDRSELNFRREDYEYWKNICAESDGCLGRKCVHYRRMCFVQRARRQAENADIIIANHSVVLSNVNVENKLLPHYKVLIIDEAHHLEDTATRQLGTEVTRIGVLQWLNSVAKVYRKMPAKLNPAENQERWQESISELKKMHREVHEAAEIFFAMLADHLDSIKKGSEQSRIVLRLKSNPGLSNMQVEIENLVQRINKLSAYIQDAAADIETLMGEETDLAQEALLVAEAGLALAADISFACDCNNDKTVHWIEGEANDYGYRHISLFAAPVKAGELLHQLLYSEKNCVIFASATLTVEGSFNHYMERSGLDYVHPDKLKTLQVDSPFTYDRQSMVYVVNDLPDPNDDDYINSLSDVIKEIAAYFKGRTLVLFTSHKVLKSVYWQVKPGLEEQDILLLGHDIDGGRTRLVEEFKENEKAVLFGAASFWEGLDIPGDALSCVVLVKLPFLPPEIPVVEARMEALARDRKNGFLHFSLPEAVIKFKQGFGRLVRTSRDRGAVVILDKRVIYKRYGHKFLSSLPVSTYTRGSRQQLVEYLKKWNYQVE